MKKLLLIVFTFTIAHANSQYTYIDSLTEARIHHEKELLDGHKSPFNTEERAQIHSLDYFTIDTNYIVNALFKRKLGPKFELLTSSGKTKTYRAFGKLTFQLFDQKIELTVYQDIHLSSLPNYYDYLIIMFKDQTNGKTTYDAGRYMEMRIPKSKFFTLDFNTAYNPYCAFSDRFNCPIPPKENHLSIEINAGEKKPIIIPTIYAE